MPRRWTDVLVDLLAATGAAVAYGIAALLQALASRRVDTASGFDPRLLLWLARQPLFAAAVLLNLGGYALHLVALRTLPLYLVQAVIAGSVAVTALLSRPVTGSRLAVPGRVAVAAVAAGLALLAVAAGGTEDGADLAGAGALLVASSLGVTALGAVAARLGGGLGAPLLGVCAGLGYAVVGVGSRLLPDLTPAALVGDPAFYAVVGSGVVAYLLYATALQRGGVMAATGPMVVAQTVVPAVVGVALLGDGIRPGWLPGALAGLAVCLSGAVALGRSRAGSEPAAAHLL